jgi:hypothetical protein
MSDTKYFDVKETAEFVRADLKAAFPGTKFSVRLDRYSMGASVDVKWTDGPTEADVRGVVERGVKSKSHTWWASCFATQTCRDGRGLRPRRSARDAKSPWKLPRRRVFCLTITWRL